jgi:hypothetical protein
MGHDSGELRDQRTNGGVMPMAILDDERSVRNVSEECCLCWAINRPNDSEIDLGGRLKGD